MDNKENDNLQEFKGFKSSFEKGIEEIKESSGTLESRKKILEGKGYILAMMTDKFDLQSIEEERFCREKLFHKALEIRIFNESGEIKWFRSSMEKPFRYRKKMDSSEWIILEDSEWYWDERQYLDIDDTKISTEFLKSGAEGGQYRKVKDADDIEKHMVTATGGGKYPLPIKTDGGRKDCYKDLQIIVRNYLDYEKDTMQLFISDWRLVGFACEETDNKVKKRQKF